MSSVTRKPNFNRLKSAAVQHKEKADLVPVSPPKPQTLSFEDEAVARSKEQFKTKWSHCGQSAFAYFAQSNDQSFYREAREITYNVRSHPLGPQDKLNGVEWLGDVSVDCVAVRDHTREGWSRWGNGSQLLFVSFVKENGKWQTSVGGMLMGARPVPCDQIPK